MCENKYEFKNQRHKPTILAESHLALTEHCYLLNRTIDLGYLQRSGVFLVLIFPIVIKSSREYSSQKQKSAPIFHWKHMVVQGFYFNTATPRFT